jgi:vacuolar-type H+-ATPase subunit I/STV1
MLKMDLKSLNKPKIIYAAIVILLVVSISFYFLKEKEKKLRIATQNQLTQTIEEKKKVENKLIDTVKAKEAVETELTIEKEKSLTLKRELEDKEQQIKTTLDRLEREIVARKKAEAQLMITLKEKENLEVKVKDLKEAPTIELEKIVIKPGSVVTGKIIMVNKDYAFVVVNLGSTHNIKVGDILSVYRNDEFIGKVQIERAEEKMSAAAVLLDWQNVEFKENDVVKTI